MQVKVYFSDGTIQIYDSASMFNSAGLFGSNMAALTMLSFDAGDLSDGLWFKYYYYDSNSQYAVQRQGRGLAARLMEGPSVQVLDRQDLEDMVWAELDGTPLVWKVGGQIVNGARFNAASLMLLSANSDSPMNERAVDLYFLMKGGTGLPPLLPRKPGESDVEWDRRIADEIGWPWEALKTFVDRRLAGEMEAEEDEEWLQDDDGVGVAVVQPEVQEGEPPGAAELPPGGLAGGYLGMV